MYMAPRRARLSARLSARLLTLGLTLASLIMTTAVMAPRVSAQVNLCEGTAGAGTGGSCAGLTFGGAQIQRVPSVFRFQTKIAQRKLPSGDEVLPKLSVIIARDDEALCVERFEAVQVQDHILNLEIGRDIDCELAEVLAEVEDGLGIPRLQRPEDCGGRGPEAASLERVCVARDGH